MPQKPKPITIRDCLDHYSREIAAITDRLNALAQELEWMSDQIDPRQIPSMEIERAA